MNNLLLKEIEVTGISEDQAIKAIFVVAKFASEQFPILEGLINTYLKKEFINIRADLKRQLFDLALN